jgi:chromate transporter
VTREPRIAAALSAITAAVVGIIATLGLLFARVVVVPEGFAGGVRWTALALAAALWLVLARGRLELHWVLLVAALAGLGLHAAGLA